MTLYQMGMINYSYFEDYKNPIQNPFFNNLKKLICNRLFKEDIIFLRINVIFYGFI